METTTLIDQFSSYLKQIGRSTSTIIAYKKDISQLIEFLQNKNIFVSIEKIQTNDLMKFIEDLKFSGKFTLKTISRKINSIKTFFKYCLQEKIISIDVSSSVQHPKVESRSPRFLSPLEYRALRDVARNNIRLYTMVEMLIQTGMTIGEISRLQRSDVILNKSEVIIKISTFSTKSARKIILNETISPALKTYLKKVAPIPSGFLFFTKTGKSILIRNIRTAINRAFKKAGIKTATVNDIRNTFIVFQLENGVDIHVLADYVGHQKSTTTERYLSLIENRPTKTVKQIKSL
ncbi:MAG: tyrosine-type recombinase/integrase [bacterium]